MNPHLTHQLAIAHIDDLHRHGADKRLIRRAARTQRRAGSRGHWLPRLGFKPRVRERVA